MNSTMELEYAEEGKISSHAKSRTLLFHLRTAYIFTKSDIKTTILPATTFAFTALFSGLLTDASPSDTPFILSGLLKSIIWTWLNLFIFNLSNQRLPNSVLEDTINKPWRAIPSGRLTSEEARKTLLISIPLVFLSTFYLGGRNECLFLMVLTWIYNDLGAAEENFFFRHLNNALGFTTFGAGAARVACGTALNGKAYIWLAVIALIITCTIQFQDMEDQGGDAMRNRLTLPLVLGDSRTRIVNAISIILFSFTGPIFWELRWESFLVPVGLGIWIACRTMRKIELREDKKTFRLWCFWLMAIYVLPLTRIGSLGSSSLWSELR